MGENMKMSKKILIFSLFLILFLGISAISAADNTTSNLKAADNDNIADVGNNDMSFAEFKNQIDSNSKINLNTDVVYNANDNIDKGIVIKKDITINGNGHTIDAKSKTRVFRVIEGFTLTLNNINFVNCRMAGENGGVMLIAGNIKITNCNFTNCNVVGSKTDGGVISGAGAGSLTNCNFKQCTAGHYGGAVFSNKLKFTNCNFTGNSASRGGAIGGTAYLYYCYFDNNIATSTDGGKDDDIGGGAGNGYFPKVESCVFTNCKATKAFGGALRGTTNAYNSIFINCTSRQGGAIRGKGDSIGCTFINCVATSSLGGAVFTQQATVDRCTFTQCSALNSNGGALYTGKSVKITNCKFERCSAPKGFGGAIYGQGVVSKCTFEGNSAKFGGAVSGYGLTVKSSTFTRNSAYKGGAACKIKSIQSSKLNKNTATYGGAVCNALNVVSSKFGDNSAKYGSVSYNDVNSVFKKVGIKNTINLIQGLFFNKKHKLSLTNSKIINSGKINKYLNYNTGVFVYNKNTLQSTYKVKKIAGPKKARKK